MTQDVLPAAAAVARGRARAARAALLLLTVTVRGSTFAKAAAREGGLLPALVELVRRGAPLLADGEGGRGDAAPRAAAGGVAAAAAGCLAELAAGNHANQECVAVEGGLEVRALRARAHQVTHPAKHVLVPTSLAPWRAPSRHSKKHTSRLHAGSLDATLAARSMARPPGRR